jgi:hypothetical protein
MITKDREQEERRRSEIMRTAMKSDDERAAILGLLLDKGHRPHVAHDSIIERLAGLTDWFRVAELSALVAELDSTFAYAWVDKSMEQVRSRDATKDMVLILGLYLGLFKIFNYIDVQHTKLPAVPDAYYAILNKSGEHILSVCFLNYSGIGTVLPDTYARELEGEIKKFANGKIRNRRETVLQVLGSVAGDTSLPDPPEVGLLGLAAIDALTFAVFRSMNLYDRARVLAPLKAFTFPTEGKVGKGDNVVVLHYTEDAARRLLGRHSDYRRWNPRGCERYIISPGNSFETMIRS